MIVTIILAFIVFFMVLNFAALHTWIERKQSAVMQDRIGANRARIELPWKWAAPVNFLLKPSMSWAFFNTSKNRGTTINLEFQSAMASNEEF